MALRGQAILAIWNDIAPGGDDEFNHWQIHEHFAERLGVPGFLRGRRYTAIRGSPRYFTLYETVSASVLTSPDYLARLNNPTPWTKRCIVLFRNNRRTVCRMTKSLGAGVGGAIATLELGPAEGRDGELRRWLAEVALPAAVARAGLVGAHLGEADLDNTRVKTEEKNLLDKPDDVVRWVLLLEGTDGPTLERACAEIFATPALTANGALSDVSAATYQLVYTLDT
jgi:hypothetical protein